MKKAFLILTFVTLVALSANAQEVSYTVHTIESPKFDGVFKKNDVVLSAGIGLGTAINFGSTVVPPVFFKGEYCIVDNLFDPRSSIGVGAYVGFASGRYDMFSFGNRFFSQRTNSVLIGVRGDFHYQFVDKLDTYAGIMLGGNIANTRVDSPGMGISGNIGQSGFLFDFFVGARYYVKPKFALFGEVGVGVAFFNIGASFKL